MTTKLLFAQVMNVIPNVIFEEAERFTVLHLDGTIERSGNKQKITIKDKNENVLGWVSCRPQNALQSRVRIWFDDWENDPKSFDYWRNAVWRGLNPIPDKPTIMQQLVEYLIREFMIDKEVNLAVSKQPENGPQPLKGHQLSKLGKKISDKYKIDELHILAKKLSTDYENLPGETKDRKVLELVDYADRHGKVSELLEILREERPRETWSIEIGD